ncbi:hypothetical protein BC829DRAFT_416203 [Chytridium lagenaria]|nr:hypothetical protein BC829DRAFT_416203 [Chytridium lagenaria]
MQEPNEESTVLGKDNTVQSAAGPSEAVVSSDPPTSSWTMNDDLMQAVATVIAEITANDDATFPAPLSSEQSVTTNPPDEEVAIQQTPDGPAPLDPVLPAVGSAQQTTSALELVVHTQQGPSAPTPSRVQAPTPASMINEARGILKNLNDTFMDSKNNADMTQRSHTENIIIILFVLHDVQRLTEKDIEDLVGASLTDILQNFRMSVKTPQKCMQSLLKTLNVLVDLKPVFLDERLNEFERSSFSHKVDQREQRRQASSIIATRNTLKDDALQVITSAKVLGEVWNKVKKSSSAKMEHCGCNLDFMLNIHTLLK